MKGFLEYFIKYPIAANLLMIGLFIMGIFGMINMKSTFFPEVESRNINIQVVYPGSSPEEIEEGVIAKIEENLKGLTGVEKITSVSSENTGSIVIEIQKGYDIDIILQDVKNAVDRINSFPASMEPPIIFKVESLGEAISFAISGDVTLKTLKEFGRGVEDDLLAMDNISKVGLSGFPDEEIEIAFREEALRSYQLTFDEATRAVQVANLELTGGTLKGDREELLIRARNKSYYARELRDIVVKTAADGSVVFLHQVADIQDKWADSPSRSFMNDEPSVVVTVQNTLEEDLLTIADEVKTYIDEFNQENDVVKATIIRDGSIVLNQRIALLRNNGIIGFFLVVILLAMFLNWRLAFWVALAIPISFAGMFLVANLIGVSINVLSLFGMILVIGILVDDGIVISENIYQKYEKGMLPLEAAISGTMEVLPAVFSAILTTVIAFATFFFIDGRLGDFFVEMAIVVILSLIFSLIEGALILPTHVAHSYALNPNNKKGWLTTQFDRFMAWMRDNLYAPVLRFAMHQRLLTLVLVVGTLLATFGAINGGIVGTTFFPPIERDEMAITIKLPAGTTEEFTYQWLDHIEDAIKKVNVDFREKYFAESGLDPIQKIEKIVGPATYEGQIKITLLDGEARRDYFTTREISNAIRAEAGPIYDAEQVTYGSNSAFGKPVSVSLVGSNLAELDAAAQLIKSELERLEELSDVIDNNLDGLREIEITLKDKARYLGLNLQEIVGQVRRGFFGSEVQRLQRGRDEVKVWVRYAEVDRNNLGQLQNMRVRFLDGREFPLSEIADLSIDRGVIGINHLDGLREVRIEADVSSDDVSVSDVLTTVQNTIVPDVLRNFSTVTARYEGQNKEQEKSTNSMKLVLPIILLLMFFVIALTFRSFSQTLIVFSLLPFGLVGVGWGHWLMGMPISLFSILGFIALVGILVNDALVFVTTFNQRIEEGFEQMEAVYDAGLSRFRPILLTSVTTIAGLGPLLLEKSFQAQFLIPMAVSVAFGLLASTLVILILLPTLLIITNRIKVISIKLWDGRDVSYTSVEPALEGREYRLGLWVVAGLTMLAGFLGLVFLFYKLVDVFI
ncbi:MAG: efflux RND transporter permease subunit [Saprospiraceae bacterium]|nr:efflux RND transporter permease subunit [Saprospiraceae bacterium]